MSNLDFLNNQFQLEDFSSEDYFNTLISPVPESKRQEMPLIVMEKQKMMDNSSEQQQTKNNPQIPYVDHLHAQNTQNPQNNMIPSSINGNILKNVIHPHNLMPHNNMLKHRIPSPNILHNAPNSNPTVIHPPHVQIKILPPKPIANQQNDNTTTTAPTTNAPTKIKTEQRKRKIAESTNNLQLPQLPSTTIVYPNKSINNEQMNNELINNELMNNDMLADLEGEGEDESQSPSKKSKKGKGSKKSKKDIPKRKRVNYCFEIHRSGCAMNKAAKLYCKVFLKGKLQSEVELIKGARGKWAYTFYDQRKKKKERRYWPSQSSGPIIEDPCNCDKCTPSAINDEEVDFSSPSTEEVALVEYEHGQQINQPVMMKKEYQISQQPQQHQHQHQQQIYQFENQQVVYYPNNNGNMTINFHPSEIVQDQYNNHFVQISSNIEHPYPKNVVLKSSNDFQDSRSHYLKSSNDFASHQRPWENYFQVANGEYNSDGFFVENNFL